MTRLILLSFFLLLSCQQEWLESEKNDFLIRCNNESIWPEEQYSTEAVKEFCACTMNELSKSSLSYGQFLSLSKGNFDDKNSEINSVLNSCVSF